MRVLIILPDAVTATMPAWDRRTKGHYKNTPEVRHHLCPASSPQPTPLLRKLLPAKKGAQPHPPGSMSLQRGGVERRVAQEGTRTKATLQKGAPGSGFGVRTFPNTKHPCDLLFVPLFSSLVDWHPCVDSGRKRCRAHPHHSSRRRNCNNARMGPADKGTLQIHSRNPASSLPGIISTADPSCCASCCQQRKGRSHIRQAP